MPAVPSASPTQSLEAGHFPHRPPKSAIHSGIADTISAASPELTVCSA